MYIAICALVIALATWRISSMLSDTDQEGLFNSLDWIRHRVGVTYKTEPWNGIYNLPYGKPGSIASGILCMWCNSIWVGILFTILWFVNQKLTIIVSLPFALSAMAIFIEEWRTRNASKT